MPFTGSHPAAVLPLLRLGVPASALVIGTLAPDLPYYLPLPVSAMQTHSLTGVLGANLLLGLTAFVVWHLVLVPPLLWAAPGAFQARIPGSLCRGLAGRLDSAGALARVCVGIVVGALTHVAWDAFTHAGMWGTRALPWLGTPVGGLTLFRWLHVVSSVVGIALLAWFAARWWRRAPLVGRVEPIRPALRWGLVAALVGWAGWATARVGARLISAPGSVNLQILPVETLVAFFSTLTVGLLGSAVAWHLLGSLRRPPGARAVPEVGDPAGQGRLPSPDPGRAEPSGRLG